MGTKSILCLTWDVKQQTDGTFKDTLLNVHGINGMTNLEVLNGMSFGGFLLFFFFIPFIGFPKMTLMFLTI
jgi:hypothetical protein